MGADPLRESVHRLIIGIHLRQGNVAAAHRAYQDSVDLFKREIGTEPSFRIDDILLTHSSSGSSVPAGSPVDERPEVPNLSQEK